MAYQNVSIPKFYINELEWLDTIGQISLSSIDNLGTPSKPTSQFRTLPVNPLPYGIADFTNIENDYYQFINPYCAILGHSEASNFIIELADETDAIDPTGFLINESSPPLYSGWTLVELTANPRTIQLDDALVGSILIGSSFAMTEAPNISLKIRQEYESAKEIITYKGFSISNSMSSKPPSWGNFAPWSNHTTSSTPPYPIETARSGRRVWDLDFSYIDDSDLWGSNQTLSATYLSGDYDSGDVSSSEFNYNIINDDNFFSQVWQKTLGGTIPFLFQPDSDAFNNDQFAICLFKENSLKATQSAFNVYDISLTIEEVW